MQYQCQRRLYVVRIVRDLYLKKTNPIQRIFCLDEIRCMVQQIIHMIYQELLEVVQAVLVVLFQHAVYHLLLAQILVEVFVYLHL